MKKYEVVVIINPQLEEEAINSSMENLETIIQRQGGEVIDRESWGKRRLAYEIKGFREGTYNVVTFNGNNNVISELEHHMKVTAEIIRYLIVRLEQDDQGDNKKKEAFLERDELNAEQGDSYRPSHP